MIEAIIICWKCEALTCSEDMLGSLICRLALVSYRDDSLRHLSLVGMMLDTRGWDSRYEPHSIIKKTLIVCWSSYGSDYGRQYDSLAADVLG